jgi:anti-sigma B factor antagonist
VNERQISVASFAGEIDFTAREDFRARLAVLADAEGAVVDLADVSYMDSSALAEILLLQRTRKHAGRAGMTVVVNPRIRRLFEIAGLQNVLLLAATLDEAKALL